MSTPNDLIDLLNEYADATSTMHRDSLYSQILALCSLIKESRNGNSFTEKKLVQQLFRSHLESIYGKELMTVGTMNHMFKVENFDLQTATADLISKIQEV